MTTLTRHILAPIGLLIAFSMAHSAVFAQTEAVNVTVFDTSVGMESGGGDIWKLIVKEIAKEENWSVTYLTGSLAEGCNRLANGQVDILTAVPRWQTGEHPDTITQESVISTWSQIYTHPGRSISSLMDLHGHTVGVVEGDFNNSASRDVIRNLGVDLMLVEFKSGAEMLNALESRWIDAAVVDRLFGAASAQDYDLMKTSIIFATIDYRFAVAPIGPHDLANVIDYHLRAMKKDSASVYHRYLDRLFGERSDLRLFKYLQYGLMATVACLLAITTHALILRYRVRVRTSELSKKNAELNEALTHTKAAEHARQASENRFASLFHSAPEGMAIHTIVCDDAGAAVDYVINEVNIAFTKHTGLHPSQVCGHLASAIYGGPPPYLKIYADTALHGATHAFETFFEPLRRHFNVTVFSSDTDQFVTILEDITDRKNAEQRVKASEEKYRLLIENANDLIIVVQEGRLKFANPAAHHVFGYKNSENMPVFEIIHPEDRPNLLKVAVTHPKGPSQSGFYTFRAYTKAGDLRWLQMHAVRIHWNAKPAFLCIIRDISETKKMENQLAQAQKVQAIGTLAGGIAHDFNNILAIILGYTELCQVAVAPDHEIQKHLDQVFKAGHRAKELVNQILTFSRQKESKKSPIEMKYCLVEAFKLLKATLPSNIEIKQEIQKEAGIVFADATRIHQIIMNLCTNAAHAMREEGGRLEIRLKNMNFDRTTAGFYKRLEPGPYVALTVTDTGCGMSQETLQRIFDPYYTTKKQGEGTGLGLALVQGIVEELNGAVNVYSEPGSGTTFNVYLPRVNAATDEPIRLAPQVDGGNETVLLVDDEKMVLDMTCQIIAGLGYQVEATTSSISALEAFQKDPDRFDAVITDQTMPTLTGKKLAGEILKMRPDLPIVLCTGFSASIDEKQAQTMGIRAFLHKPILREEIARVLRQVLDTASGQVKRKAV